MDPWHSSSSRQLQLDLRLLSHPRPYISRMKIVFLFFFLPYALAFELPFGVSKFFSSRSAVHTSAGSSTKSTPKIAIIGAGAGGSSAAFWISKGKERFGLDVQVDVYESSDYIGGRTWLVLP